jgi:hypothetical protein
VHRGTHTPLILEDVLFAPCFEFPRRDGPGSKRSHDRSAPEEQGERGGLEEARKCAREACDYRRGTLVGRANQKLIFFPARQRPPGKTARPLPRIATPHRARCSMREMAPPFSDNRPCIIALPTRGRAHTFRPRRCSCAPWFPRREDPAACGQTVDLIRQEGGGGGLEEAWKCAATGSQILL